ncbi:hypothetical protein SCHPADRAFT_793730, partial [Schizopora paradoxa]
APGEALAELATMNSLSYIDAVMSEDSDALCYGAEKLVRRVDFTNHEGTIPVDCVPVRELRDANDFSITRGTLLLMALLSGGENLEPGVEGCELSVALMLGREGFGDRLVNAVTSLSGIKLERFLANWRKRIKYELETNNSGLLDKVYNTVAFRITNSWPSVDVIKMYLQPITSLSFGKSFQPASRSSAQLGELARLCEFHFSIPTIGLLKVFEERIWHGLVVDALLQCNKKAICAEE